MPLIRSTLLLCLALCLAFGYAYSKPVAHVVQIETSNNLTITDYEKLVKQYRYYKPDSAVYFAQMAIAHARRLHDGKGIALMLNQLGMIDDNRGDFESSKPKYLEALSIYKRISDPVGQAAVTVRLGVVELRKGNYDKAIAYFLQSLKISERSNNTAGRMEAYLTLAEGYIGQRKFDIALKYLGIAESINNTIPFSNLSLNIYNNFGIIYRELGLNDKAKAYLQKGIALSNEPQYQGLNITLINNLAKVYNKEGNKPRSIQLQRSALDKARKIKNYLRELQTLTGLADTYGASNSKEALLYFGQALQLVRDKGARKQEIDILGRMSALYKYQRNFEVALKMKEEQNALADSFFYKAMSKQVVSLQAEHQLYKSRAKVRELNQISSSQLWQRNFYIGLSAASLLTIMVITRYFYRTRKLNKLLNTANSDLVESNRVKDKLFSVLAHDLRAPFASVIDLMYLLEDDDVEPDERKALMKKLTSASNVTLETLNMLLKWGEMQIKGVKLNTMIFQPKPAVERVLGLIAPNAEKKHVRLKDLVDPTHAVMVDPNHFEFVVRNLLANAVKFTPSGGSVEISSRVSVVKGEVIFAVKDSGVGIKAERIARIFDISNASTKGTNNETGTSLGLTICKEFIELNKGRIWVESMLKQGSTFYFSLPLFKVTTPTPPVNIPVEVAQGEAKV